MRNVELKRSVLSFLRSHYTKSFDCNQIREELSIERKQQRSLLELLDFLVSKGRITKNRQGQYQATQKRGEVTGRIEIKSRGKIVGFVSSAGLDADVLIPTPQLRGALHGDVVRVLIYAKGKKHFRGEVLEIIEARNEVVHGTICFEQREASLESSQLHRKVAISMENLNGAANGEKVLVKVHRSFSTDRLTGEVVEVLGKQGEHNAEMLGILGENGFTVPFPDEVLTELQKITREISEEEISQRRDFRDCYTITIDPDDAKDFDDALSLKPLEGDSWEVGVHIADVSHYVCQGKAIDKEAFKRGTSVYLVDRVVPMLPEELSNDLCSLNPHTDKLTFSVVFKISHEGKIKSAWIGRTVIHSNQRLTYQQAQDMIDEKVSEGEEVRTLYRLANLFRTDRFAQGSFNFETDEVRFHLSEDGTPIGSYIKKPIPANYLVEEFMLLANQAVAKRIGKMTDKKAIKTFLYRIHDTPERPKLEEFRLLVKQFGYDVDIRDSKKLPYLLNDLFKRIEDPAVKKLLELNAIRSMAKAKYSTANIGHYGLAFDFYSHFTSPIRRYPDLMVHRLLTDYFGGKPSVSAKTYEDYCEHCNNRERAAISAERSSVKYKQVELLQSRIGGVFQGTITGVVEWGFFVELSETMAEGLVRIRSLNDDAYYFEPSLFAMIGHNQGKIYKLGDTVTVLLEKANLEERQIDLKVVTEEDTGY